MKRIKIQKETSVKTISEGYIEFVRRCKAKNLSLDTIRYYDNIYHLMELFCNVNSNIEEINEEWVDDFILFLKDRNVKDTTIQSNVKGLRTILYFFMEKEYMSSFKIKKPHADEPIKEIYTAQEIEKLLKKPNIKNCSFSELRTWAMTIYFLGTGQRLGTVLNLKIKDIDFDNELVYLYHMKSRKQTILPLGHKVLDVLSIYLKYRGGEAEDYLFCTWTGTKMTKRGIEESFIRYNKSRGVNKTSIHAFRHTFATNYLKAGGDLFRLQKLMCHSNINITKEYLHLCTEDLAEGLDRCTCLNNFSMNKLKSKAK